MFVDLCFSMSNWDLYSSISVLVCYCSTPCVSTISRLHVSSLAPVFYLNVSILVIPNEESTIFNRSSSASWVCQCHRLRHTTARPTAITSYRLLNFPCQVFVFLLSQTPLTLTSTHPTSSAPALCTVLFWTSFTQAPFSFTHMYSVLLAPPLHLLPVLTIVPSVVCTIAHMKGLRVES